MVDKNFQMLPTHMAISYNLRCELMSENRSIHKFLEVNIGGKNQIASFLPARHSSSSLEYRESFPL